mmetsp:Transcript_5741/g.25503  ORF Transcript_5741/g.25503 Transcript_5741/m.25503 type:complete len:207 (+) Transcript_5741:196-816(+)
MPCAPGSSPTASPCSRSCHAASTGSNPRGSASSPCGRAPTSTPSPPPWRLSSATTAPARASPLWRITCTGSGARASRRRPRGWRARRAPTSSRSTSAWAFRPPSPPPRWPPPRRSSPCPRPSSPGRAVPSPTQTQTPRTRPRSSTSKRTSPRSYKRSTMRCSNPRRRPRRRRRRTRGLRCPRPWAACSREKTKTPTRKSRCLRRRR